MSVPASQKEAAMPSVWCVVLNWNACNLLTDCLYSLMATRYNNLHIVVADNGSTDDSVETVERTFPEVHIVENAANLHYAAGNNPAIDFSLDHGAQYVLLLNNDTIVEPDFLKPLVEAVENRPGSGIAGPKILYADAPRLIWFAGADLSIWKARGTHRGIRQPDDGRFDDDTDTDYVSGCAMLVRRDVLGNVGLLDEGFQAYYEDADFCLRAQRAGFSCRYVAGSRIYHKVGASYGLMSPAKLRERLRSQLRFARKHSPPAAWFTTIPFFLFADAVRVATLTLLGRLRPKQGF